MNHHKPTLVWSCPELTPQVNRADLPGRTQTLENKALAERTLFNIYDRLYRQSGNERFKQLAIYHGSAAIRILRGRHA